MLATLGIIAALAALFTLLGWLWLTAVAFRRSRWWGIAVLVLSPLSALAFAVAHWRDARTPFLLHAAGFAAHLAAAVALLAGPGGVSLERLPGTLSPGVEARAVEPAEEGAAAVVDARASSPAEETDSAGDASEQPPEPRAEGTKMTLAAAGANEQSESRRDAEPATSGEAREGTEAGTSPAGTRTGLARRAGDPEAGSRSPLWPTALSGDVAPRDAEGHIGRRFDIELHDGRRYIGTLDRVSGSTLVFTKWVSGGRVDFVVRADEIARLELRGR